MSAHTCHAQGCETPVPERMFMCKPHWRMVPGALRADIWYRYVPGQEHRKDPSAEYLDAAARAIDAVAAAERS